jgi:gliding motility-associated-like protein
MLKNLFIAVFLVLISFEISAQLVINEVSQGPGGSPPSEYVELLVAGTKTCTDSCANLQTWILDDNNGFFGGSGIAGGHVRFNNDPQWQCVPYGTIIVIYNPANPFPGIVIDETDANNDNVYFLPSNSSYFDGNSNVPTGGTPSTTYAGATYSANGAVWDVLGMQNGNDVFQTVAPTTLTSAYHSVGWGSSAGMDIVFAGSASGLLFQNENITNDNPYTQSNWASQAETVGTPGTGNSVANTAWINGMRNSLASLDSTINETICDGDSIFFDNQYLHFLGTYKDTLVSALGCDSIVTLNLNVEICSDCAMDLGNDRLICGPVNETLDAGAFDEYLWQDGSTNQTFTAAGTGQYYCVGTNFNPTNLVVNGGFESGNVNFSTDYIPGTGGSWGLLSNPSQYAISTSPSLVHNNFLSCGDHTSGSSNMFVANGSSAPNSNAWCQSITVDPNSDYIFSAWAINADGVSTQPSQMAELRFSINGTAIGATFLPSVTVCNWTEFQATWNSGSATSITLCIENTNFTPGGGGADFALDDIFFGEMCIASDTINILSQTSVVDSAVVEACFGESALIFGNNETQEGLYLDTLRTVEGCDSIYLKRYLEVGESLFANVNSSICFGDSVFLQNTWQNTSNTYYDTLSSSSMCDSLLITNLTVSEVPTVIRTNICSNVQGDEGLTLDTLRTVTNCDSIYYELNTIYEAINVYHLDTLYRCIGESAEIFGNIETESDYYTDTILSVLGCDSIVKDQVLVINDLPTVSAGNDVSIAAGDQTILTATGGAIYVWSTGEDDPSITVSPQSTIIYTVAVENAAGCADSGSVTVFVLNENVEMLLPNAFTPNADNLNDVFKIVNEADFENISIRIYNRWGEMVFSSIESNLAWDGTYNGKDQAEDNYTYYLEATAKTTKKQMKVSGSVTLFR